MNQKLLKKLKLLKEGFQELRQAAAEKKNQVLVDAADLLLQNQTLILKANEKDLKNLDPKTTPAFRDRLTLNSSRLEQMAESLRQVAALEDPVGEIVEKKTLGNGLQLQKIRAPLGVIFMIFESRPNVAVEAFSLAFKSGNVIILRGGRESMHSTTALYKILSEALKKNHFSINSFWGVTDPDRKLVNECLKATGLIDIVVPRGGDKLIEFVVKNSLIPIIKNDRGLCHVYVHEDADLRMALDIVENAKTHRPGVCNAMETVLVHQALAPQFLPELYDRLGSKGVIWYGCAATLKILKGRKNVLRVTKQSFDTEYLDLKMNCRVVKNIDEALKHIEEHGSKHSESIVTASEGAAERFENQVDAAAVYRNASTRFTDGFEFGLGGELGISTQKLHVRGPVGLRELTNLRWVIHGNGQIRK